MAKAVKSKVGKTGAVSYHVASSLPNPMQRHHGGVEQQADTAAERVVSGKPVESVGRASPDHSASTRQTHEQLQQSGGRALEAAERDALEPQFKADLGTVRVHDNSLSQRLSEQLQARAFTVGEHVAFNRDEYQPGSLEGRKLLAHEVAHVMQQRAGGLGLHRKVKEYGTKATVSISPANVEAATKKTYWHGKIGEQYELVTSTIDSLDVESQNNVLATIYGKLPATLPAVDSDKVTAVYQVASGKKAITVYTRIVPISTGSGMKQPQLYVDVLSSAALTKESAPPIPKGHKVRRPSFRSERNISSADRTTYKEDFNHLFYWYEKTAPKGNFVKLIETSVKAGSGTRKTQFVVQVDTSAGSGDFTIYFIGSGMTKETPPAKADEKSAPGYDLEKKQSHKTDKVGTITYDKVPKAERGSADYTALEYFNRGARATEVDQIIPIAGTKKWSKYTFIFDTDKKGKVSTTDITIRHLGTASAPAKVTAATKLDVRKVNGFPGMTDDAKLASWVKTRYPGVTLTKTKAVDIVKEVNAAMVKDADGKAWFKSNYDIEVNDAAAGKSRMQTKHKMSAAHAGNIKSYGSGELSHVERSLETLGDKVLAHLKGLHLVRQIVDPAPKGGDTAGQAYSNGTDNTVVLYDKAYEKSEAILGSRLATFRDTDQTILHELGHVASYDDKSLKRAFDAFVKKEKIPAFTDYAKSKKKGEFFAEAYGLYYTDPEWMKTNYKKLYDWFTKYDQTGKKP